MGYTQKLSEFELDVMNLFWQNERASAPQIHELICEQKFVSYSTVKTIIDRLEQKQALSRAGQSGRTIFYQPAIQRDELSVPLLKGFLKRIFAGKPQNLIAQLIEHEELSDEDIKTLEAMLTEKKAKREQQS